MARREWSFPAPQDFSPDALFSLVGELRKVHGDSLVLILDEIDQLLEWDRDHSPDEVPEAFFRTCRSISQQGLAQFIFSGERVIASRVWDPHSPHWNFCRPIQLAQLTQDAASALLLKPLLAMNVQIVDEPAFAREAWARTSGHPQIVQTLGDRLVRSLDNRRDRGYFSLSSSDVTDNFSFAEHYLSTYWGQATSFERRISEIICEGAQSAGDVTARLRQQEEEVSGDLLLGALRMLQLYGIIEEREGKLRMRAEWFSEALSHFGRENYVESRTALGVPV